MHCAYTGSTRARINLFLEPLWEDSAAATLRQKDGTIFSLSTARLVLGREVKSQGLSLRGGSGRAVYSATRISKSEVGNE